MALGYLTTLTLALAAADADGISVSQTPSGAGNLTITGALASGGVATMDVARRVIITSAADDHSRTFTITGTGRNGLSQSETIAGGNAVAVQSVRDYLTVTQVSVDAATAGAVTVGTNGAASTAPILIDTYANRSIIGVTMFFNGTVNSSIEVARDDLSPTPTNFLAYDMNTALPNWTSPSDVSSKTSLTSADIGAAYTMLRLTQNTFTSPGTCGANIVLPLGAGPY